MIRVEFSNGVAHAIEERATGEDGIKRCEECGAACLKRGDYEIDHTNPEAFRIEGGEPVALKPEDGKLLCIKCHDRKTRRDLAEIARAKRIEAKHRPPQARGESEIARRYRIKQEPNR